MTTLTICIMLASAAVGGAVLGASAVLWYRRRTEAAQIARQVQEIAALQLEVASLGQRNVVLNAQVMAMLRANYHTFIAVDLRRPE